MKINKILYTLLALSCVACSDKEIEPNLDMAGMITSRTENVNERFDHSMTVNQTVGDRLVISLLDDYKVYVGTDMHIDREAPTAHTDAFLNAYLHDLTSPMCLILGDIVNGRTNMDWVSDHLRDEAGIKAAGMFLTLGNHDIYFDQWQGWTGQWGSSSYTVEVRTPFHKDLYVCFETASGFTGTRQLKWLREVLDSASKGNYRHLVVFTHTHMFMTDKSQGHTGNYPLEESYELMGLMSANGVELFLSGHDHSRDTYWSGNVQYVVVDALEEHYPDNETGFMVLSVGDGLDCRFYTMDEL